VLNIKRLKTDDAAAWDNYVYHHPLSNLYHLSIWKYIIEQSYSHKAYYLMATDNAPRSTTHNAQCTMHTPKPETRSSKFEAQNPANVVGILPLVQLKHFIFGHSLISIPFFDLGGILADSMDIEKTLLSEAIRLAQELKVNSLELRQIEPLSCLNSEAAKRIPKHETHFKIHSHKVRMLLNLPESSEILMKSFKSKLRSQIRKPIKEGLKAKTGQIECLDQFYQIFANNMRDLGSPVHSRNLVFNVLKAFPKTSKIITIYKNKQPMACSLIIAFKNTLENPWASSLRKYSPLSPNMLLYWTMLDYACNNGFNYFDFGRSTPNEGTYKFKKQWGAKSTPLYWHYLSSNAQKPDNTQPEKSGYTRFIALWKKIPVPLTKIIGPPIRKHIGL